MGQNMKANGKMIYRTDMVSRYGLTVANSKEIINKVRKKVMANTSGLMEASMKATGKITRYQVRASTVHYIFYTF